MRKILTAYIISYRPCATQRIDSWACLKSKMSGQLIATSDIWYCPMIGKLLYLEASETVTDLPSAVDSTLVLANTTEEPKREIDRG